MAPPNAIDSTRSPAQLRTVVVADAEEERDVVALAEFALGDGRWELVGFRREGLRDDEQPAAQHCFGTT